MTDATTTATTRARIAQWIESASIRTVTLYITFFGLVVLYLLPLAVAVVTSFKTDFAVLHTLPVVPPKIVELTITNWLKAFNLLKNGLINSLTLTIPVAIISATMGSMTAYGLTQINWRGQVAVLMLLIAAVFLPTQAAAVPLSKFWAIYVPLDQMLTPLWRLPLLEPYHGDLLALIITDIAFGIPICTILFRAYYKGISNDMIEAATVDGASWFSIYRRIILPLSGPMFAVTLIYQFTQTWNSFLFPLIIMYSANHPAAPVTLSLAGIGASLGGIDYGLRMAGSLLTALPTIIVFLLFGERFAEGVVGRT